MGWQPGRDAWPGDAPGQDGGLPAVPAGFAHEGPWACAAPSALLATALEEAAGPECQYEGADTDAMVGIVSRWAAIESWAAASKLAALRAMMREDASGRPLLRRRADLPDGWDDSLNYEIAGALAMGPVSAGNLASLAWTVGVRLPAIGRLLADGTLTVAKAKLVVQVFEPLTDEEAARAEALLQPELTGKTYFQVERLAWRAAVTVAPDVAERRRSSAEKERARVAMFREDSGAVGLSGRDLPAAEALSGHANLLARAAEYERSGAFPGRGTGQLQVLAYLDLLNGVAAADRIAFARAIEPGDPSPGGHDDSGPDCPAGDKPCSDAPGSDDDSGDDGPSDGSRPGGDGPRDCDPGSAGGPASETEPDGETGTEATSLATRGLRLLPEFTVPLATLLGVAERTGDCRLLGSFDPALARSLAAAAARAPASHWEITIVDDHGYAIGHGVARPQPRRGNGTQSPGPPPGGLSPPGSPALAGLPARVNVTVTETALRHLAAQPCHPAQPGAPPGGARSAWTLIPKAATPKAATGDGYGTWNFTLPAGRKLTVTFEVVPTHACDHRYQTTAYQPGPRLRRLVQVRDHECTFPTCTRPARESDFEHARPYDQGGPTDACNAGARSRRCHQVKQLPGWSVTQPRPGWHTWTTPTGRAYTQEPWRYPA